MRLIKPSFEIIEQKPGIEGVYKQIELAGRTCYKSHDKITLDSAKGFVDRMIKSGHGAMLEHGTVYLYFPWVSIGGEESRYTSNKYSKSVFYSNYSFNKDGNSRIIPIEYGQAGHYVTTNLRVLVENNWLDDLQYLCEPTEYHEKRITVRFVTDQGILREFTRHRTASFAVESTRYCNYSKEKFNNELTFIIPCWANLQEGYYGFEYASSVSTNGGSPTISKGYLYFDKLPITDEEALETNAIDDENTPFIDSLNTAEQSYFKLLNQGWKPQQARNVLPLATKCEMIMTAFVDDWWGEYLVFDKSTDLLDQRIHGMFWKELDNIDREKYRIVEKGFFPLRCSSAAHPQAQELAIPLREEFIKRSYIK